MTVQSSLWEDIRSSIFNFCNDFAGDMVTDGVISAFQLFNWDAVLEQNSLPEIDLIGPWQLSCDLDATLTTVRGHIGISVIRDLNLFKLEQVSGLLLLRLVPGAIIPLYGATTGAQLGQLTVTDGTSMSSVAAAKQRSLKFIAFTVKSDVTMKPKS